MTAEIFTGLLMPDDYTEQALQELDESCKVSAYTEQDVPDWEERLKNDQINPMKWLRKQRQQRNDCNGQSGCSGGEKMFRIVDGTHEEHSDTYLYQACEFLEGSLGRDRGSQIPSVVKVLTKGIESLGVPPGLPTEASYPYNWYTRHQHVFEQRAKGAEMKAPAILEHYAAPRKFKDALIIMAMGGVVHWGTWWPLRMDKFRIVESYDGHGGGAHATEIVWAVWDERNNRWLLVVLNSHGDGYFFLSEQAYESMVNRNNSPFGAYAILPDNPVERLYTVADWKKILIA